MARTELKNVSLPTRQLANDIIDRVARYYGFGRARLLKGGDWSRSREISWARHVCVWAVAPVLEYAWTAMTPIFQRDHSTLVNSNAVVEHEIDIGTARGNLAATTPWEIK